MTVPEALIECVPNFSEGRDQAAIDTIARAISSVDGVRLLDVDPGHAANRTVVTFVGAPEPVLEAAFRAIRAAREVIDMRRHRGEHPRMGATDVCPLVPVANIELEDVAELARRLGERVGRELDLPVYLYAAAASRPDRAELSAIRSGEYEGLEAKLADPAWAPDCGPAAFDAKAGATVIGARNFLVAYNVNLNTTSVRRANAVAFDLRESGRVLRGGDGLTGEVVRDDDGRPVRVPGRLKAVKGIGWFIEEYGIAQVSLNLTDLSATPLHAAFDAACEVAAERGMRATGSEIVGLVPLGAMLDAGRHYLERQERSLGVSDDELIKIAIRTLGLDELAPFDPQRKIIELAIRDEGARELVDMPAAEFARRTASEAPAPGGGSAAAYIGAMAAALGTMVANLSAHKRGWEDRWASFSDLARRGHAHMERLLQLVDEDTRAFDALMDAYRQPKATPAERETRSRAIQTAVLGAIHAPLAVMREACAAMEVIEDVARKGLDSAISDAGCGALCARSAVRSAWLNVRINAPQLRDRDAAQRLLDEGRGLLSRAEYRESAILEIVEARLAGGDGA